MRNISKRKGWISGLCYSVMLLSATTVLCLKAAKSRHYSNDVTELTQLPPAKRSGKQRSVVLPKSLFCVALLACTQEKQCLPGGFYGS